MVVIAKNKVKQTSRKQIISGFAIAAFISIAFGTSILIIQSKSFNLPIKEYLLNAGYSIFLGLLLFANGPLFRLVERGWLSWVKRPFRSLVIALSFHLIYSTIAILFVNWLYFIVISNQSFKLFFSWGGHFILLSEYVILLIITAIIYAKSFFKEWRIEVTEGEKLKQEAISLQYQVMQNQVNPHFLFNSLNTLGSLIDIDTKKAKEFTRELSLFYRELLFFKDKDLISLKEEISFLERYIYLQKIRFGDNFNVEIDLGNNITGEVIPMSVQMMVENAIKHNIISNERPLSINIGLLSENELFVENNFQPRENVQGSNRIGLNNLKERYMFLTGKELTINNDSKKFRVTIPLIILQP
ncbi:MAG: histidine kinase [Prolixibacteraceae bacterium]|nr:histidine kinase [Prolixibacteraceae bacterium]